MKLELQYNISKGTYEPYFIALRRGEAMASHCFICAKKYFPPRSCCDDTFALRKTAEHGKILYRTNTLDKAFALVRFNGCDNNAIGEIINPSQQGKYCVLVPILEGSKGIRIRVYDEIADA